MVVVDWSKLRAGAKTKRAQRRAFDTRRPYAAPNLITKLIAMTAPLAEQAAPRDRGRLFLNKSESTRRSLLADGNLARGDPAPGRARQRQTRSGTGQSRPAPRSSGRTWSHPAARLGRDGALPRRGRRHRGVQSVLNHASLATTEIYVRGPEARAMREARSPDCRR